MKQFATWNPEDKSNAITLSDGNLTASIPVAVGAVRATIGKSSGKWYWETTALSDNFAIGISTTLHLVDTAIGTTAQSWALASSGIIYTNGVGQEYCTAFTAGTVLGIALDMDAGTVAFYKNGLYQGIAYSGLTGTLYPTFGANGTARSTTSNFGATAFAYAPPAGFEGLSSDLGSLPATLWRIKATDVSVSTTAPSTASILGVSLFSSVDGTGVDLALTSIATASSTYPGLTAANAVDGDAQTQWASNNIAGERTWVQLELAEAAVVRSFSVDWKVSNTTVDGIYIPKTFDLQYSLDGGLTWATAAFTAVPTASEILSALVPQSVYSAAGSLVSVYSYTTAVTDIPALTVLLAPNAPTGVVASSPTLTSMSVSFTAPLNDGGASISSYTVTSNDGKTAAGTASPIVVTGLVKNTSYTFTVTATNSVGVSEASEPSSPAVTLNVPNAPTIGTASLAGTDYRSASISFTPPEDNGVPITGYTVTSNQGGFTATGLTSPITVAGLAYGASYVFSVVANSANGDSNASGQTNTLAMPTKTFITLDPAAKSSGITLSNGNLSASSTSGGWYTVYSQALPRSGKWYWEITGITSDPIYGIAPAEITALSEPRYGFNKSNPRGISGLITPVSTTVYGFALDLDNGALYVSQNGVWLNGGNPLSWASKTGSVTINGSVYVVAGGAYRITLSLNGADTVSLRSGAALSYSAPAGYHTGVYRLATPAKPPTAVSVQSISDTQATISFTPTAADPALISAVTGYRVTAMPGNITATAATSPIVVPGLQGATEYTFSVQSINADGISYASASVVAETWTVPDAPTNVVPVVHPGKAVRLTFSPPVSSGGGTITQYRATSTPGSIQATAAAGSDLIMSGLTPGVEYTFEVEAYTSIGWSELSEPSAPYTVPFVAEPPTSVVLTAIGTTTYLVTFDAPTDTGGNPVLAYNVASDVGGFTAQGSETRLVVTGLARGTAYRFRVNAVTQEGTSAWSTYSLALATPAAPVQTLTYATWDPATKGANLYLTNGNLTTRCSPEWYNVRSTVGKSSGKWYWEFRTADNWGNAVIGIATTSLPTTTYIGSNSASGVGWYCGAAAIYFNGSSTGYQSAPSTSAVVGVALDMDAGTLTFYKNGVSQGVAKTGITGTQYAAVSPYGCQLTANFGATAFAYAPPAGHVGLHSGLYSSVEASAPVSAVASNLGVSQASVSFAAPADLGSGSLVEYMVVSVPDYRTASGTASPIVVTGLRESTEYTFQVMARTSVGLGASATTNTLTTIHPPAAPIDIVVTNVGAIQADVNGTVVETNGGDVTQYTVTAMPGNITAVGTALPVTITGLSNGTQYTVTLKASNTAGYGPESEPSAPFVTDDRIVHTPISARAFELVVPPSTPASAVLGDLEQELSNYGWEVYDQEYHVYRALNLDGETYKIVRLQLFFAGPTTTAVSETYESWDPVAHTGVNRAGPSMSGQTVADYTKTSFVLTSDQTNYVRVYACAQWILFGSYYNKETDRFGYKSNYGITTQARLTARDSSMASNRSYDLSVTEYSGMSGVLEFSREGLSTHGQAPCWFWTHTGWMVDDKTLLDPSGNRQTQHDQFYTQYEPRPASAIGLIPSVYDQDGVKHTVVPVTYSTAYLDLMDGRFLREPNPGFPTNIFNSKNPILDLPCQTQYGFLGVVCGLKVCRPDGTLPTMDDTQELTCDANFNLVRPGYGTLVPHLPIATRVAKTAAQYNRTDTLHNDPIMGNGNRYYDPGYWSYWYNQTCGGGSYNQWGYGYYRCEYMQIGTDTYYTYSWALDSTLVCDFKAKFYIPA